MTEHRTPEVIDERGALRFAVYVDGEFAGAANYARQGDRLVFTHTEVDDAYRGQGIGSALVRGALDIVRSRGERASALCPFVNGFIARHPEYDDIVDRDPPRQHR